MQRLVAQTSSIPIIQYISKRAQIAPEYVTLIALSISFILIQKTTFGGFISNLLTALVIMRDVLLTLKSTIPKPADLRRHVIVLSFFLLFVLADGLGAASAIPLFGVFKLVAVIWAGSDSSNAERVYETILSKAPSEYLQAGDSIEQAVKVAASAVNKTIESDKDK
ncbi:receptor expression-enhancing protein 5/6 [Pancytospora epiphaga]|nr:receptor expression-enhancing protein 5/6 [Pancytospora epiphaga]